MLIEKQNALAPQRNARQLRAMRKFHVREGQNGRDQMRLMYFIYF